MSKLFRSRESNVTATDAKTQLTLLGSQTAPGPLLVPGAMSHLLGAYVICMSDSAAAESGAFLVRLEGPGIARGSFVFAAGGAGADVATGGAGTLPATYIPIGIKVTPGQEILVFAEQLGTDLGTSTVGVTLVFSTEAGPGGETLAEITVEGEVTAIDTLTRLTTQGSVAAPSRLTPPDSKMIKRIVIASGCDGGAAGQAAMVLRLSGDAIKGGEQTLFFAGHTSQTVQAGSDAAPYLMAPLVIEDLDIEITPNETLDVAIEHVGVDVGDTTNVVTVMFA